MTNWTNITITKDTYSISISVSKDEEILNKQLEKITPPTTKQNYTSGPNDTKIVDLLRIEQRINIDGHLITDGTSTASTKKSDLISAFKAGGQITMTYEGSDITGNIEKLQIGKHVSDGIEPKTNEIGYNVKFTFLRGVDFV